jgi:transposase
MIEHAAIGVRGLCQRRSHLEGWIHLTALDLAGWLKRRKIKAVIPSTATRRRPYPLDPKIYQRRNVIERMFCKLKNWRRIATRYDRHAQNYLSALALAAIMYQ